MTDNYWPKGFTRTIDQFTCSAKIKEMAQYDNKAACNGHDFEGSERSIYYVLVAVYSNYSVV